MKQTYIAPQMEVIEIDEETPLMTISAVSGGLEGTTWGGEATNGEADANGRRGSWGNLWEDSRSW